MQKDALTIVASSKPRITSFSMYLLNPKVKVKVGKLRVPKTMAGGLTLMTSLYPPLLGSVFWDRYGPGKRDGKWKTRTEKDVYTVVHHNPENPIAIIETSMGTTRAEIFLDVMPITASNFIDLANKRFYDGLHIHSVTPNYIVQVRVQRRDEERCPIENRHACGREHSGRERAQWERERRLG